MGVDTYVCCGKGLPIHTCGLMGKRFVRSVGVRVFNRSPVILMHPRCDPLDSQPQLDIRIPWGGFIK